MPAHPALLPFPPPGHPDYLSVSELTSLIKTHLESTFDSIAVSGQISGFKPAASGHCYFQLKDERAVIKAIVWNSLARKIPFELSNGLAVRARGRLDLYPPRGEYSLVIEHIEPEGLGALELAFRQLFERLKAEGLFDPERKRTLPPFPRRIILITSPTGAAVRDFLQIAARRWPPAQILISPVRVQGEGAALEIAQALNRASRVSHVDAIVLARGGGSTEDLWAFNEEPLARAIAAASVPVVSAIGHEIDTTIADFVADHRAPTPSAAAELLLPDADHFRHRLDQHQRRLAAHLKASSQRARLRLDHAALRLHSRQRSLLDASRRAIDDRARRLLPALERFLERQNQSLATRAARLHALSPLAILARGYSLSFLLNPDGSQTLLRTANLASPGDTLLTRLDQGSLTSKILQISPDPNPPGSPP
jgi:exodeoxyribonuclease VII large subunit